MQAHGTWGSLFACVAVGALVGAKYRVEPAKLAGSAVVGHFS